MGGEGMLFSQKFMKTAPITPMRQGLRVFVHDASAVQALADLLASLPLVGTRINELAPGLLPVYGTLEQPVHAVNLKEKAQEIKESFPYPLIIAVDACLGQLQSVGSINMGRGSLQPGTGVNKKLPSVGEIFFSGVVNIGGYLEYLVLQNTRLSHVMKMADCIVQAIITAYMLDKKE